MPPKHVSIYDEDVDNIPFNPEVDEDGRTPLMVACMNGHSRVVEHLMQAGAGSDYKDKDGYAGIHLAVLAADNKFIGLSRLAAVLRGLAKYRAVLDRKTEDGRTAIHLAIQTRHEELIPILRDLGADLNRFSTEGYNAIYYSCMNAAQDKTVTGVASLVRSGAKVDKQDPRTGKGALHVAAEEGMNEIMRFLVLSKAHFMDLDRSGTSPMHIAVQKGNLKGVQAMIEAFLGQKDDAPTDARDAILRRIQERDGNKMEKKLQEIISYPDKRGNSILHIACGFGYYDMVIFLLRNGADPYMKNNKKVKDIIEEEPPEESSKKKKKKNRGFEDEIFFPEPKPVGQPGGGKTPYHVACEVGHANIFKAMVRRGIETIDADAKGHTCLHYAAMNNDVEIAETQLEIDRNPNPQNKQGWTPLHYAAMYDSVHIIVCLLDASADVTIMNTEGQTPLELATRTRTKRALQGVMKEQLAREAHEKERRHKEDMAERKKRMQEMQDEAMNRAKNKGERLLSPRSDDEEEIDPLANKRKDPAKPGGGGDDDRPGSRASSKRSGTGSHKASRQERSSPRSDAGGSRPGSASSIGTLKSHPPGHDKPMARFIWKAKKKYGPVVERVTKPMKDKLAPIWNDPRVAKKRKQLKYAMWRVRKYVAPQTTDDYQDSEQETTTPRSYPTLGADSRPQTGLVGSRPPTRDQQSRPGTQEGLVLPDGKEVLPAIRPESRGAFRPKSKGNVEFTDVPLLSPTQPKLPLLAMKKK